MKHLICIAIYLLACTASRAQKITGHVTDMQGNILPYSSITIKGKSIGTTSNAEGKFVLKLSKGDYTITCQHVGYQLQEKSITLGDEDFDLHFQLMQQTLTMNEVIVKNGEDAAYEIIRNAIKKRPGYKDELKRFTTEVYTKGVFKLRNFPKKFMGQKVDFEDGDTSKRKTLYLSESLARYSVEKPNNSKVEVLATKVSGQTDGFGLSAPQIISFYENMIPVGSGLNPRGFISPIAENALRFYKYHYEGSFMENGKEINHIKVIPKHKYEPAFSGYINIIEGEWRIHSLELLVVKDQGLQILDTLRMEQLYVPLSNGVWVIKNQVVYPSIKMLGFDAFGSFVNVYSNYDLDPQFPKGFFNNTVLKYTDSSNKKTTDYWNETRPIALQKEEVEDYRKKDSIEQLHRSPKYLDSLDRVRNKLRPIQLVMSGQSFGHEKARSEVFIPGLVEALSYNTVEGVVLNASATYTKRLDTFAMGRRSFSVTPDLRYGFNNKHFYPNLSIAYRFGKKEFNRIAISGGSNVFQFNNDNPVNILNNSISTLFSRNNPLKIYEARFARIEYARGLEGGFVWSNSLEYQDRLPLENTTDFYIMKHDTNKFTPNYPDTTKQNLTPHQAFIVHLNLRFQPGTRYVEFPGRKISIGSKYPVFDLEYTTALPNVFGSDLSYGKWQLRIAQVANLKLAGALYYQVNFGGFLYKDSLQDPDYIHFKGTSTHFSESVKARFLLVSSYYLSNASRFYTAAFVEHHFNGLITNKIPLFRKLKWNLVVGANGLWYKPDHYYLEPFVGLENILRFFRVDYVYSIESNGSHRHGFRFGLSGALGRKR